MAAASPVRIPLFPSAILSILPAACPGVLLTLREVVTAAWGSSSVSASSTEAPIPLVVLWGTRTQPLEARVKCLVLV